MELDPRPDTASDPMSTAMSELVYRREGEGFVLYSLGRNGKDDGGVPRPMGAELNKLSSDDPRRENWDIVWRTAN